MPNSAACWRIALGCSHCLAWALPSSPVFSCVKHRRRTGAAWFSAGLHLQSLGFGSIFALQHLPWSIRGPWMPLQAFCSGPCLLSVGRKGLFQWPPPLHWVWRDPEQPTEGRWCVGSEAVNHKMSPAKAGWWGGLRGL